MPVGQEIAPWGGWHRVAMTERGFSAKHNKSTPLSVALRAPAPPEGSLLHPSISILIFASSSAPAPHYAADPRPPKRIAPKSKHHIRCSFKEANISFPAHSRFTMPKPGKLLLHCSRLLYNHYMKDFCGLLQKSSIGSHAKIRIKSATR